MQPLYATPYVPGRAEGVLRFGAESAGEGVLSILTATELPRLKARPTGILALDAAPLSHLMIRLFGAGIPAVILDPGQGARLREGDEAVLDGVTGLVCAPGDEPADEIPPVPLPPGRPVRTSDGVAVSLRASVGGAEGAALALASGAEAIGLVRSEYLMPADGTMPDAEFYRSELSDLCRAVAPLPVRVRLLDLAADKRPPWLPNLPGMLTPLGLQGCRLFDREPFRGLMGAEVDALGRVAPGIDLSILIPFVTGVPELRRWRNVILERLPTPVPVGAMAETPAAVLALPDLLEEAGFAGIGCNDLLQCLFAADRDLPAVAGLVDPYAPAVYRFLRLAADAASGELDRVQVCGLLPQLPGVLPVLIGLGFRAFSVEPMLIPRLARRAGSVEIAQVQSLARAVCAAGEAQTVRRLLGLSSGHSWGAESFDPGRGLT